MKKFAIAFVVAIAAGAALVAQTAGAQAPSDRPATVGQMKHVLLPSPAAMADPVQPETEGGMAAQSAPASAGLTITPTFDTSITSDPNAAAIEGAINAAIATVQSQFSDPITVKIKFVEMTSGLGMSSSWFTTEPYPSFLGALKGDAKTADDATAISLLPSVTNNPVNSAPTINVKFANLRAVGIATPASPDGFDGTISLNTTVTSPGSPGSPLTFSLQAVALHEIDEVLGLGSWLPDPTAIVPEDLFRYSAVNTRTFTGTDSRMSGVFAYFSIDAATQLAEFDNQNDGGDFGDWQSKPLRSGVSPKVQDAFATAGANPSLSVELRALDVIGYDRSVHHGARFDFDGDGKADVAVFRPSTGQWFINPSSTGGLSTLTWGASTDIPVAADFDGDGKVDITVFRPSTGQWFIHPSSTGGLSTFTWGASTDIPVAGDFDGDGKADVAVFRPSTGQWFINPSSTGGLSTFTWGVSTDIPVVGDFDGDGKADIAVFRPSTGQWFIMRSGLGFVSYQWGASTDIPVAGDFDGDGKTDIAVFRPATGEWFILQSSTNNTTHVYAVWGASGDVAVPADYDGDGKTDIAVFRPSTGQWFVQRSSLGFASYQWGASTDIPIRR